MRDPNTGLHFLRKRQRGKVIALGLDHQPYRLALMDIQHPLFHQIGIHSRIKPAVINDIVHMAVDIVV